MCDAQNKLDAVDQRIVNARKMLSLDLEKTAAKRDRLDTELRDARAVLAHLRVALCEAEEKERTLQIEYVRAATTSSAQRDALREIDRLFDGDPGSPF